MIKHLIKKILLVLLIAVLVSGCGATNSYLEKQKRKERLVIAEQMFKAHCKTAGVKIYKTAKDVEGIYLMKIRPKDYDFDNQFKMNDPYGKDLGGEGYIKMFLRGYVTRAKDAGPKVPPRIGYHCAEANDPKNGQLYRYTGSIKVVGQADIIHPNVIP